jgi:hypothetical protein
VQFGETSRTTCAIAHTFLEKPNLTQSTILIHFHSRVRLFVLGEEGAVRRVGLFLCLNRPWNAQSGGPSVGFPVSESEARLAGRVQLCHPSAPGSCS